MSTRVRDTQPRRHTPHPHGHMRPTTGRSVHTHTSRRCASACLSTSTTRRMNMAPVESPATTTPAATMSAAATTTSEATNTTKHTHTKQWRSSPRTSHHNDTQRSVAQRPALIHIRTRINARRCAPILPLPSPQRGRSSSCRVGNSSFDGPLSTSSAACGHGNTPGPMPTAVTSPYVKNCALHEPNIDRHQRTRKLQSCKHMQAMARFPTHLHKRTKLRTRRVANCEQTLVAARSEQRAVNGHAHRQHVLARATSRRCESWRTTTTERASEST